MERMIGNGMVWGLLACTLLLLPWPVLAQIRGDDAELARLRSKAEDAMANDDPDGAAMMMGRAALLAAELAKKHEAFGARVYKGNEALFRAQEHAYRAMALFRRAGGQSPASSGVCGSLALAQTSLGHIPEWVTPPASPAPAPSLIEDAKSIRESAENLRTVIESMMIDYQCP